MPQDLVPAGTTVPARGDGNGHGNGNGHGGPSDAVAKHLLFTVLKWRRLIVGLCAAFTVAAAIAMVLKPTTYAAAAKLLLKSDRIALQISGMPSVIGKVPHSPQLLQSEIELIKSREVLLPVVEAFPVNGNGGNGVEAAVVQLRQSISATAIPDTNVIQVSYTDRSPERVQAILRRIVDEYMEQHAITQSGSTKLLAFYEQERSRAAAQLRAVEQSFGQWQEANKVYDVEGQIRAEIDVLTTLEKALHQTEAEADGLRAKIANLTAQLRVQPERTIALHERVPNPLIAKLKGDLAAAEAAARETPRSAVIERLKTDVTAAEVALHEIRQRYTDKDRRVQGKKETLAMLRRELAAAQREAEAGTGERLAELRRALAAAERESEVLGKETVARNPLREGLEKDLAATSAAATATLSQRDALRYQLQPATRTLADLADKKLDADRMSHRVTRARDTFALYDKRLEEARIAAGLDKNHLSNIALIEKPYLQPGSDLLSRIALVLLAAVAGLGFGVASAFGMEFFNRSLKTADDVEYYIGLPALAAIPALPPAPPMASSEVSPIVRQSAGRDTT